MAKLTLQHLYSYNQFTLKLFLLKPHEFMSGKAVKQEEKAVKDGYLWSMWPGGYILELT